MSFNKSSSNKDIHPFENASTLEFWSQKNDAAFVLLGSHSKKRPHNLTMARMFNHQMLDMLEIGVEKAISMADFKVRPSHCGFRLEEKKISNPQSVTDHQAFCWPEAALPVLW